MLNGIRGSLTHRATLSEVPLASVFFFFQTRSYSIGRQMMQSLQVHRTARLALRLDMLPDLIAHHTATDKIIAQIQLA